MSLRRLADWLVPSLLWVWLFFHLQYTWSLSEQYNYGWAVPFLAAFLFYLRWQTRPAPDPPSSTGALALISWLILFVLLPIRVVEEANPDWRLLSWMLALLVVAFSFLALARAGGARWTGHFAFPVCFPLVAVPWLVQVENAIIHGLTRAVAYAAVEVAAWVGIGAYQVGNVIQIATGFVGVDEACSGVKTLQAAIMVSLFLGELLGLNAARRVALLAWGCAWVFACNVFRATALVIIAARSGIPALEHWHDSIGTAVLVVGMGGLAAGAFFLSSSRPGETQRPAAAAPIRRVTGREVAIGVGWLAVIFAGTEIWYRSHERHLLARPAWRAEWPAAARAVPIADETRAILRYNDATSASWTGSLGEWWGFFSRWEPGRAAVQLVRSHSPEICLPAIGRTFVREVSPVVYTEGELQLRFRSYEFVQGGQPLFVFVCIQEDKKAARGDDPGALEWSTRGRLRAALAGERNLGQRLLELAVVGFPNAEDASRGLLEAARQIVRPAVTD